MKGRHIVKVVSRKAEYTLELERKISIIKGKSGTGKSSVIRLIADFLELGKDSGIKVSVSSSASLMVFFNSSKWEAVLPTLRAECLPLCLLQFQAFISFLLTKEGIPP